jgi:hypothetical protein
MATPSHEQLLRELVAQGNDEQVVRLVDALLTLGQGQIELRVELLVQLGRRYLTLALAHETGKAETDCEQTLQNLCRGAPMQLPAALHNDLARLWCREAHQCLTAALDQAPPTYDTSLATAYREAAQALISMERP